jgi:hypothetical protein
VAHDATPGGLPTLGTEVEGLTRATWVEGLRPAPESSAQGQTTVEPPALTPGPTTLGSLPVGARLVLRCRADWRAATVAAFEPERVVLSVASPTGHTYRVRRPHDSPLAFDGGIPVLGGGGWRAGLARYDVRW